MSKPQGYSPILTIIILVTNVSTLVAQDDPLECSVKFLREQVKTGKVTADYLRLASLYASGERKIDDLKVPTADSPLDPTFYRTKAYDWNTVKMRSLNTQERQLVERLPAYILFLDLETFVQLGNPIKRGDFLAYKIPEEVGGLVFVVKSFDTHSGNADVISFDENHSEWKERTLLIFANNESRVLKPGLFWFRGSFGFCDSGRW
jgi:hypothetical protein